MPQTSRLVLTLALSGAVSLMLGGCGGGNEDHDHAHENADGTHTHADGTTHADHDHVHNEVALGRVLLGEFTAELAQGHGLVEAGDLEHLVVKLSYSDHGETVVRAWIGTEDRTLSEVGKGEYAPSHDDYDIHVNAPDPLPEGAMWWFEVEKPDGTKAIGSIAPLTE